MPYAAHQTHALARFQSERGAIEHLLGAKGDTEIACGDERHGEDGVPVRETHAAGFEPATLGSEDRCSDPLSYACLKGSECSAERG